MDVKINPQSCRACMRCPGEGETMENLLDTNLNFIWNQVTFGLNIEVSLDNRLPVAICTTCKPQIVEYFEFREKVKNTEKFFRLQTGQALLKDEPIPVDNDADQKAVPMFVDLEPSSNWLQVSESDCKDGPIKNEPCDKEDTDDETSSSDDEALDKSEVKKEKVKKRKKTKDEPGDEESKEVFACDKCDKKFFVRRRYDGHMRAHDGLKVAPCLLCDKEFSKWSYHDQHVESVHSGREATIKCEFAGCDRAFTTRNTMMGHLRSVHTKKDPSKVQIHMCDICGKTFGRTSLLRKHTYTHSADKPFKCTICPRQFPTKHKLKQHVMRHEGIKNYVCPHCGMKKTTMDELKVHINYHTKEKIYKCKYCAKEFGNIGNMGRHIRIVHEGIRAYACTFCDMRFGKSGTLKHHLMTHTGEKPHACEVFGCGKRFIQNVALKAHMKTHKKNTTAL